MSEAHCAVWAEAGAHWARGKEKPRVEHGAGFSPTLGPAAARSGARCLAGGHSGDHAMFAGRSVVHAIVVPMPEAVVVGIAGALIKLGRIDQNALRRLDAFDRSCE